MAEKVRDRESGPAVTARYHLAFLLALGKAIGNVLLGGIYGSIMRYFCPLIEKSHDLEGPHEGFLK